MKTIFITGASSGIGKASAILFQSKGWNVIATMRNPDNATDLASLPNVTVLPLDVLDTQQIQKTVQDVMSSHQVDVVLNNAGYGLIGALEACSEEQITRQISTNLTGVIHVTKAFIPYFKQVRGGTIINVTSMGGIFSFPLDAVYHATKWGVEGLSESLAFELSLFNIKVKTVAPGTVRTEFFKKFELVQHTEYQEALQKVFAAFNEDHFTEVNIVAEVIYEAATDEKDQLRYLAGEDVKQLFERWKDVGSEIFHKELESMIFGAAHS